MATMSLAVLPANAQDAGRPEIASVVIRGNHTTPDTEVLALAGVRIGDPYEDGTSEEVARRLRASGRFQSVDVRKRFASFSDPDAVVLVIVIGEQIGISIDTPRPGPLRRLGASTMWLPVLAYEDGYGFTYGARVSLIDVAGRSTRLTAPLTWGGERRASVVLERTFARGPLSRVEVGGGAWRREVLSADLPQRRAFGAARVERAFGPLLRIGAFGELADVAFGALDDRIRRAGADVIVDTRRDRAFPRNAVFASVTLDRLWFDRSTDTSRLRVDVRGFLGLPGKTVLVGRVQQSWSAEPLPPYEQEQLGGTATLRGFRVGYRAGDRVTAASIELRRPITSPLRLARFGVAAFVDRAAVYSAEGSWRHAEYDTGVGAGWFVTAPVVSLRMDVAHGVGAGTRVHVTVGVRF